MTFPRPKKGHPHTNANLLKEERKESHRNNKSSVLGKKGKAITRKLHILGKREKKRVKDLEKYGESSVEEITSGNPTPGDPKNFSNYNRRGGRREEYTQSTIVERKFDPFGEVLLFWSKRTVLYYWERLKCCYWIFN